MKKIANWILPLYIAFVFLQSLFFKFSGSEETVIIFNTIGTWMLDIGLPQGFAEGFSSHGGIVTGVAELIAAILVLIPITRVWGALAGTLIMSGAIFFHLFTPLGVVRIVDAAGNTDGGVLFFMACGVWLSSLALLYVDRQKLLSLAGR
ncbi:MAG: hypothetical protein COB20_02915 [SAR86 cluster bacterium]|uniref:DoxX family protein n=1 Tax=SAR86 cluster bacterium TaxID=2030880 RepID=A0A2A4XEV9_9GAMM|nr:MAG: hypothetical protein COB20_02915 [SAR86 cluster bacterium]